MSDDPASRLIGPGTHRYDRVNDEPVYVVFCGSRAWKDRAAVRVALHNARREFGPDLVIVTGGARGADTMADEEARTLGYTTLVVQADWEQHGRAAGPIRNKAMLDLGPARVYAFWDGESPGTANMIRQTEKRGISITVVRA